MACAIQEVTLSLWIVAFSTSCAAAVSSSPPVPSHPYLQTPISSLVIVLFLPLLLNPKSP